jgi:hypothetical protein
MPNEFIIKNGFRSQGNSEITGSIVSTSTITGNGSTSYNGIASTAFGATATLGYGGVGSTGGTTFDIFQNGSPAIGVAQGGNVAVGAGGNAANGVAKLLVKGSGTTSATTAFLVQNANASSSLAITDDGQINMIASGGRIKFIGPSSGASGNGIFWGVSATGTTYGSITLSSGGGQLDYLTNTSYFHRFITLGGTEVMRIGTGYTANIGIRTASPQVGFHIATTTAISGSGSTLSVGTLISSSAVTVYKSGSTVLDIQGSQGQLFSVIDALSGSLMSVNDVSGLPILEVFSDDRVVMGTYGAPALIISGSAVTVATASVAPTGTVPEGTFRFATVGGAYYIYAYLGGAWRSGSLF